ncbi:MAG: hypothetical protein AAFQ80_07260 [Cyanobacteria bacterium J06621_8]
MCNICDLEFIEDSVSAANHFNIRGGTSATAVSNVYTTGSGVYANAYAGASGDYTSAGTATGTVLVTNENYYVAGYGYGYGTAYGVDSYYPSSAVTDSSYSYGIV